MIEQLQRVDLSRLQGSLAQGSVVSVEAGHIYTDETPGHTHELSARVGAQVVSSLEAMGLQVQTVLFVDDYNASSRELDVEGYKNTLSARGFPVEQVVFESSLVEEAETVIADLGNLGLTKGKKDGKVYLKSPWSLLRKSSDLGNGPACNALDAALYIRKSQDAGMCVTVLPKSYKDQQFEVKTILRHLGKDIPILNVFYDENGDIEVDFEF